MPESYGAASYAPGVPTATVITLGHLPEFADLDALTPVIDPDSSLPLIARTCAAITRLAPTPPLVIVAEGEWAALLPGIALAQRSARRSVLAYVLIDPEYPEVSDTWPDTRVHVLGSEGFDVRTAELRGWETGTVTLLGELLERLRAT